MIQIDRVLSVSSEDPNWPAENLLKGQGEGKWKCKTVGEKNATVVLQLEKASKIKSIDVGNENSAFIEILVGKSCLPDDNYKVLLVASSLMTLREAKDVTNSNSVRFFKEANFCKPEYNEKWDRIKIVCSQPYNKHIQFGLSFINFHSEIDGSASGSDPSNTTRKENNPVALGRFLLKEKKDDGIAAGSVFARRKQLEKDGEMSAVAIRAANSQLLSQNGAAENSLVGSKQTKKGKAAAPSVAGLTDTAGPVKASPSSKRVTQNTSKITKRNKAETDLSESPRAKKPRKAVADTASASGSDGTLASKKTTPLPPTPIKRPTYKPFQELMRGVIFTISGFQNPLRGDIRSKALAMGAKYKPDWDNTCTHLVCAFPNTPKFSQVRGHGKIVKKEWIENCHSKRIKFPWRRYALDPTDCKKPESEDEILEGDENQMNGSNSSDVDVDEAQAGPSLFGDVPSVSSKRKKNQSHNDRSPSSPTDITNLSPNRRKKTPAQSPVKKKLKTSPINCSVPSTPTHNSREKIYYNVDLSRVDSGCGEELADTESDSDWLNRDDEDSIQLPYLPEQFDDLSFFIADDIIASERADLQRYIIAHSGCILKRCSEDTEYVIAAKSEAVNRLKKDYPQIIGVRAEWVWKCHDENRLIPTCKFEL